MGSNSTSNIFTAENLNIWSWRIYWKISEKGFLQRGSVIVKSRMKRLWWGINGMKFTKKELGKNSWFISKKECSKREREMGAIKTFVRMVRRRNRDSNTMQWVLRKRERERVTAKWMSKNSCHKRQMKRKKQRLLCSSLAHRNQCAARYLVSKKNIVHKQSNI